ncbi:MAG TPA: DUF4147 domain-containing protein [Candidatus Nitrosotalea sp.]|nr:DUF4147 domain-containing protein [Candidatus Nitrosotalea sp.]
MMPTIKNRNQLGTSHDKKIAISIIEEGLRASLPNSALEAIFSKTGMKVGKKKISLKKYSSVNLIAIGKSADLMAMIVSSRTCISKGIVVIPTGMNPMIHSTKFEIIEAGHPIPDAASVAAATGIIRFLRAMRPSDFVIFLISGGASSLVSQPEGITLKTKQIVNELLIKSGASIGEINCVRKHLSKVKGGRILGDLRCDAVSLVMSDVIGDDLSVIGSGITYCDKSTFFDARKVLMKYRLKNRVPKSAWNRIALGVAGKIPETPKRATIENFVIRSNKDAVKAMAVYSRKVGYRPKIVCPLYGDVRTASAKISSNLPPKKHSCLIFGGETTVRVRGKGLGGRNQELVLNLLKKLKRSRDKLVIVALGTDGVDGNSSAAGAIVRSDEWSNEIERYLARNDSFSYFKKNGSAIFTGHTHTNVMDIGLVLR